MDEHKVLLIIQADANFKIFDQVIADLITDATESVHVVMSKRINWRREIWVRAQLHKRRLRYDVRRVPDASIALLAFFHKNYVEDINDAKTS